MSDFATQILFYQPNSTYYHSYERLYDKTAMTSGYSKFSNSDSGIELWHLSRTMSSPDSTLSPSSLDSEWNVSMNYIHEKTSDSDTNTESEFKYYKSKRASSLKTKRTPPGTPKSKAVRFADALGLDLEDIRHIFNLDMPPKIPASAVQDLVLDSDSDNSLNEQIVQYKSNFDQPGATTDFLRRVRMHNVVLENAFIDKNFLCGSIRVMNLSYEKRVTVRVTFNDWITYTDFPTKYLPDSYNTITDLFSFSFLIPAECSNNGKRIQFAVSYDSPNSGHFWDNNFGQNYQFICSTECRSFPNC